MENRKLLLLIISIILLLFAGCSNDKPKADDVETDEKALENLNESGMPIVKEPISLNIFAGKAATTADDWNDVMIWNKYEEMTNMDITWEMVPSEGLEEKRNLALASGTLPDVFHTAGIPNLDLLKYGQQGIFLKLNDLIDKHAPNLKKLLEEYPEIKKGMTFPDGNIYGLPTIYSPEFKSVLMGGKFWIKRDWLDTLGMEMPTTTEDFYQYLKAVKEEDPNGNGKADEIPFGDTSISGIRNALKGSFGIGNRGTRHAYIDMDPASSKVRFYPIAEGYKELLTYLNKLYKDELIQQNIYSIDYNQFLATGSEGLYGSLELTGTENLLGDGGKGYVGLPALEGPNGDHKYAKIGSPLVRLGGFVITENNKNPAATVRWMDHFYGDEGAKLFFMGIEGETYEETEEGKLQYVDKITNSPDGLTMEQELSNYLTWMGGGYPGIVKQDFFNGGESLPPSLKVSEELEDDLIEDIWPKFTYTEEESRQLSALSADIEKYVDEMQDKFITGNISISKEWNKYVETVKDMGLKEYMEIKQAAYDRYERN